MYHINKQKNLFLIEKQIFSYIVKFQNILGDILTKWEMHNGSIVMFFLIGYERFGCCIHITTLRFVCKNQVQVSAVSICNRIDLEQAHFIHGLIKCAIVFCHSL